MKKIAVVGYGSIGKRHVQHILSLGYTPYVLTKYKDTRTDVIFIDALDACPDIEYAIIATPTACHTRDVVALREKTTCKKILIEKPLAPTVSDAISIKKYAQKHSLEIFVAYNMRFLNVFEVIKNFLQQHTPLIRMVKITAGQYLPEWRPHKDYRTSYSASRKDGGGVDLDLSHEIDYMGWLFGVPQKILLTFRDHVSSLEIDSPDYFKGLYRYDTFLVDVTLDYIQTKNRTLEIQGENTVIAKVDFIQQTLEIEGGGIDHPDLFDFETTYKEQLKEFFGDTKRQRLCSIDESIHVLECLQLAKGLYV